MKNPFLLLCMFWWAAAGVAGAQREMPAPEVRVLDGIASDYQDYRDTTLPGTNHARLGDTITLRVENLWMLRSNALKTGKPITLFLGGHEVTNLFPQPSRVVMDSVRIMADEPKTNVVSTNIVTLTNGVWTTNTVELTEVVTNRVPRTVDVPATNVLSFHLKRLDQNNSVWRILLRRPFANWPWESKIDEYSVSVGLQKGEAVPTAATLQLVVYEPRTRVVLWGLFWLAVVVGFFFLATHSELLRDKGGVPAEGVGRRPYSLARVQMACWFLIAAISYVFIYLITGELDTLNPQVLILMGISSVTYLAAVAIDQNSPEHSTGLSENWVRDILSDKDGISFHRFQMLVWTVILGAIFFTSVIHDLTMPEFSATMLGLMGLSAGTYLGFKFPSVVAKDTPAEKRPKNQAIQMRGAGSVKFTVEPWPGAEKHELWTKADGQAEFTKLVEVPTPNPLPNSWRVETPQTLTVGKKVSFKWRGVKGQVFSEFTEEESVTPT